jgi:hypothetical protein
VTFLELQDQTLRACGHSTAATSDPRTRVKAEINTWQRRILTRPGYSRLLRDSENTFSSVTGQRTYGLGLAMGRLLGIQAIVDRTVLALRDTAWLRRAGVLSAMGTASAYIPRGWFPVQNQPSNPSAVVIKSANAADTTQVVDWTVVLADLNRVSGSTTLTGTTPVALGTASTIVEIVRVTLRTAAVGLVSIIEDNGAGPVLSTIPIGQTFGRYLHVELYPTPASVLAYRIDYTREIADLVQDTDQPLLPPDYHHLLALGAEYDEWRKLSDDRMVVAKQDLEMEIKSLNAWVWDLPDDSQLGRIPTSRLGGNYPADSWR